MPFNEKENRKDMNRAQTQINCKSVPKNSCAHKIEGTLNGDSVARWLSYAATSWEPWMSLSRFSFVQGGANEGEQEIFELLTPLALFSTFCQIQFAL